MAHSPSVSGHLGENASLDQRFAQDGAAPEGQARFDDGKAADAFRTIGEVAQALGIRPHVLRYWEDQFPMLRPVKRNGGRRYYRPADVALLEVIDRLVHREGYTLRGARQWLESEARGAKTAPVAPKPAQPLARPITMLHELQRIRAVLAGALQDI